MSDTKDHPLSLNVRLKPREPSARLFATNDRKVSVAQGLPM